jgi:hypothetical protein
LTCLSSGAITGTIYKKNAATSSSTTKKVPLDADVKKLLNGGSDFAPVGLGCEQFYTPCIEKRHLKLKFFISSDPTFSYM